MPELEETKDAEVQQPSTTETPDAEPTSAEPEPESTSTVETHEPDPSKPHPLEPEGDRFKQVWARGKKAEEEARRLDAQLREEREARIRLEERLNARESQPAQPEYSWEQLRAAIDAGQITEAKAFEIRDNQLYTRWQREQASRDAENTRLTSISTEMNEYKRLVPNAVIPGTEERTKVEREYGYIVQRLGAPKTESQKLSYELTAARAAFGDVDTLRTKATVSSKPLTREPYMETSGQTSQRKDTSHKKSFKDTLTAREVEHYERMMRRGSYQGGWADVEKEHREYTEYQTGLARQRAGAMK